nr:hypothetical protein Iba_chr11bCG9890 [Ipomoea batatas]
MNGNPNSPFLLVLLMMSFLFTFSCTARHEDVLVASDVGSQKSDAQYYPQVGKASRTRMGLTQRFSKQYLGEGKVPRRINWERYDDPPICYSPPCYSSGTGRNGP